MIEIDTTFSPPGAAANGFSRSLAREVGRAGITVNTVAPGFIETELTKGLDAEQKGRIASRSALRRLLDFAPWSVQNLITFRGAAIVATRRRVRASLIDWRPPCPT